MHLANFSTIKPQRNVVLLLLVYSNTRLTQLRRLRFQFQLKPSLPRNALLIRKYFPSLLALILLIVSRYTSEL